MYRSNNFILKEGAYFISDAHYSHLRPQLLSFIREIHAGRLPATQLIFMGDIFDALFGGIEYTYKQNQELIDLINELSYRMEILYLEGNHDFNLKSLFTNLKVVSIKEQPFSVEYGDKKLLLAHGDFDGAIGYRIYTSLIRSKSVLAFLRVLDNLSNHSIIKKIDNHLSKKNDCKEFKGFQAFIERRLSKKDYNCSYFIEGHYHQNRVLKLRDKHYINLGAFACNQRYFIVKSMQDKELLQEEQFS